ncbi:septum site-determining protein MinC [Methylocystis sp. JAN1]|uniref:septum site-determining protein MinC n=1 Tax=Methylocystis sp. JAN1 TaxID=3397211 RepID=UPI003FA2BC48
MTQTSSRHIRFRGCSFPALALEPEGPLADWIGRLDSYLACSPAFFAKKAIVVDVSRLGLDRDALVDFVRELGTRRISILGVAGADPRWASDDLPPILAGGRASSLAQEMLRDDAVEPPSNQGALTAEEQAAFDKIGGMLAPPAESQEPEESTSVRSEPASSAPLLVDAPVRSGQTIFYPQGDVIVIGSVSSGADVVAGGSIHVYGALRGRAMAGAYGETRARIFCRRLEAELLAIGGIYRTADEIDENLRRQNAQVWLEKEDVRIALLDQERAMK